MEGRLTLQRQYRLKKRGDFRKVFQRGKSFANRQFVVYHYTFGGEREFRLGISVSRKVGNAVVRNRIKRLVKEVVREWKDELKPRTDIVIIARNPVAQLDYHEVKSSIRHAFSRAKLFHK